MFSRLDSESGCCFAAWGFVHIGDVDKLKWGWVEIVLQIWNVTNDSWDKEAVARSLTFNPGSPAAPGSPSPPGPPCGGGDEGRSNKQNSGKRKDKKTWSSMTKCCLTLRGRKYYFKALLSIWSSFSRRSFGSLQEQQPPWWSLSPVQHWTNLPKPVKGYKSIIMKSNNRIN